MLFKDFSGGLNDRIAPHLLAPNEAQIYTNVNNENGTIKPVKQSISIDQEISKWFTYFYARDQWISKDVETYFVEYREKLYYTENGLAYKYDGNDTYPLGIDSPEDEMTLSARTVSGKLNGTYTYVYTYYNKNDGTEGSPSPVSDEITVEYQPIDIGGIVASYNPQVSRIRIYRSGGNLANYALVEEIANATVTTYIDDTADVNIDGSVVLESTTFGIPPDRMTYLTSAYAMLFGAVEDKLYFSNIGSPDSWPSTNFLDFDDTVTGIGALQTGLLVFTKFKTYIVTGNSPTTLSKYLLDGSQGCIAHSSIEFADGKLIWVSLDGVCATNGGAVTVISKPKLGKKEFVDIHNAQVYDNVYYLAYDKKIMAFDFRYNKVIRMIEEPVIQLGNFMDTLYAVKESDCGCEWSEYTLTIGTNYYGDYGFDDNQVYGTLTLVDGPDLSITKLNSTPGEGYTANYRSASACPGMTDVIVADSNLDTIYTLSALNDWSAEYYDSSGDPSYYETNNGTTVTVFIKLVGCDQCTELEELPD